MCLVLDKVIASRFVTKKLAQQLSSSYRLPSTLANRDIPRSVTIPGSAGVLEDRLILRKTSPEQASAHKPVFFVFFLAAGEGWRGKQNHDPIVCEVTTPSEKHNFFEITPQFSCSARRSTYRGTNDSHGLFRYKLSARALPPPSGLRRLIRCCSMRIRLTLLEGWRR